MEKNLQKQNSDPPLGARLARGGPAAATRIEDWYARPGRKKKEMAAAPSVNPALDHVFEHKGGVKKTEAVSSSQPSRVSRFGLGEEKEYVIENLAMLVRSGMDLLSALSALKKEIRSKRMKRMLTAAEQDVNAGSPLWKALERTGIFPPYAIGLIRMGEGAGRLPENLTAVVQHQQKERVFRSKIHAAMLYPVFVLSLAFTLGVGISWFILPRLASVFATLRIELPLATRTLITVGKFLGQYGSLVVPLILVAGGVVIYFLFVSPGTRFLGQSLLFRFPGLRKLIQEIEVARFGFIVGTLLASGLSILEALDSLKEATTIRLYKNFYAALRNAIEEGNSFQKSFSMMQKRVNTLIPIPVQEMVVAAEQSGHLSTTLREIGGTFGEKTETTMKNLSVLLEPILLVIVWLGVIMVAVAIILPIYSLVGGLDTTIEGPQEPAAPPITVENVTPAPEPPPPPEPVSPPPEMVPEPAPPPPEKKNLKILPTELGYLNVRDAPSRSGRVIQKILPGAVYEYRDKKEGWYEIVLPDGKTGWVSERYVKED